MDLALMLGRRGLGLTSPNPSVGAVLVKDGVIVGRGWTQKGGRPHAEVEALRRAGKAARDATMYVTLEPCSHHGKSPPCADAIVKAGVARVVSAVEDVNPEVAGQGHARLRAAGITVDVGLGRAEALRDQDGHVRRMRDHRPHVTLKLAVSADGMIGRSGARVLLTGEAANAHVHLLRAQHDAMLVGIGTALADDPLLTCRLPGMEKRSPIRIVLDRQGKLPPTSRLAQTARDVSLWIAGRAAVTGAPTIPYDGDLAALLRELAARGVTRLLVEGGAKVASAFAAADLVDEAWLIATPKVIGAKGIAAPLEAITASPHLALRATEILGEDTLTIYARA
jgi:diaminohydroxyphosphoribosylaminopyrimidine deaminase/5-amino-6-(5-phosphoribosylamino)uracil reductase